MLAESHAAISWGVLMSMSSPEAPQADPTHPLQPRSIAMPFRGRWIRKVFVRGLGLPRRKVYDLLMGAKATLHPRQVRERRRIGQQLAAEEPGLAQWHERGYRMLEPAELPGLDGALSTCRSVFETLRAAGPDAYVERKDFLLTPVIDQQFCAYPGLVRFIVAEPLLRMISAYLGSVPVLASARLWWSPASAVSTPTASQRYHSDHEDTTQVKLVVYIEDVAEEHGPFTLLRPDVSDRIRDALGTRRGRIDDAQVARFEGGDQPVVLTGPAGTAALVDSSRCLHYGSRSSGGDRFVLLAQFLRYDSPVESALALRPEGELARENWSPLQRLVLGLRD